MCSQISHPEGYLALAGLCDCGVRRCMCASTLATFSPFHPRSLRTLKKGPLFQVQTQPTLIRESKERKRENRGGGWALYKCSSDRTTALLRALTHMPLTPKGPSVAHSALVHPGITQTHTSNSDKQVVLCVLIPPSAFWYTGGVDYVICCWMEL